MTPMRQTSSPTLITMVPLSDSRICIERQARDHNGGALITTFMTVVWNIIDRLPLIDLLVSLI